MHSESTPNPILKVLGNLGAWVLAFSVLATISGCPRTTKVPEQPKVGGMMTYDYSGLKVIHQESARDYVHIRLHFGWQQPEESSYMAQIMAVQGAFTCGAGSDSPEAFAAKLEASGATMEFGTGLDGPVVSVECLPARLDATWELVMACIAEPMFDRAAFQAMRDEHIQQQRLLANDPSHRAKVAAIQAAWPQMGLDGAIGGSEEAVRDVSMATAQETFTLLMRKRCNLRLVVVGGIESERISDLLEGSIDKLPEGECATASAAASPQLQQAQLVQEEEGAEAFAAIFPAPGPASVEATWMRVAMQVLDRRMRLHMVDRDHVATFAQARYLSSPTGVGMVQVVGPNAFRCAEFCLSEIRILKTEGVSEAELRMGKAAVGAVAALEYESAPALASRLDEAAQVGALNWAGREQDALARAGTKEVNAVIGQYLTGIAWGIVGDTSRIDRKSLWRL
ncbi:MAG: hypothetical protein U0176_18125 [Bacteroidia bacterium]